MMILNMTIANTHHNENNGIKQQRTRDLGQSGRGSSQAVRARVQLRAVGPHGSGGPVLRELLVSIGGWRGGEGPLEPLG